MYHNRQGDAQRRPEGGGPVQAGAQDQREVRARARQGDEVDETYGQKQAGEHGKTSMTVRGDSMADREGAGL